VAGGSATSKTNPFGSWFGTYQEEYDFLASHHIGIYLGEPRGRNWGGTDLVDMQGRLATAARPGGGLFEIQPDPRPFPEPAQDLSRLARRRDAALW
jgi:hypothetical protein